ncbi:hypothetical protein Q0Z83_040440 [Actinoplanes sichuanensis]|uniref:Uncharacterized protein n=1 Tax=Actinoplanes sichuanensis TaxID=512349 RepID=A0ABW4A519_9ACTN|nr:hypothetical protein [Actinoplanes sichuanensis]BEL05853.1 hypothetical protein Q0Z83_040440 [Actinoplanes sichuanensis]
MPQPDLATVLETVDLFASRDEDWEPAELSAELRRTGWTVYRAGSTPYPSWLEKSGLQVAILHGYEALGEVALQISLEDWAGDWSAPESSSEYVRSVLAGYPAEIEESRRIGRELVAALSRRYPVSAEDHERSDETFAFVFSESWRAGRALLILGIEHLDPDDTPIELNLYVRH